MLAPSESPLSDPLGDGKMGYETIIRSGYSSRSLDTRSVPIPEPVPPPIEWQIWNPWRQSQSSTSRRAVSRASSMISAPSV